MKYPNKDYIEHLRRKYPPGTRLQLSCMEDEMAVPPGSMGTVDFIDDAGQIHRCICGDGCLDLCWGTGVQPAGAGRCHQGL